MRSSHDEPTSSLGYPSDERRARSWLVLYIVKEEEFEFVKEVQFEFAMGRCKCRGGSDCKQDPCPHSPDGCKSPVADASGLKP